MNRTVTLALATLLLMGTSLPAMAEDAAPAPSAEQHKDGGRDGPRKDRGAKMFEEADANKDGELTKDEMLQHHEKRIDRMFEELDADKSGKLSKPELSAGREKMREKAKERWKERKGKRGDRSGPDEGPPQEGEDGGGPPPPPEE